MAAPTVPTPSPPPPRETLYVFAIDVLDPTYKDDAVLMYLRDAVTITNWSHPLPGVFLIRSYFSAFYLSEALRTMIGDASCLVIEADPNNKGGWLTQQAWDWFKAPAPTSASGPALPRLLNPARKKDP